MRWLRRAVPACSIGLVVDLVGAGAVDKNDDDDSPVAPGSDMGETDEEDFEDLIRREAPQRPCF